MTLTSTADHTTVTDLTTPATRCCALCHTDKPMGEFGFKSRARGTRQSYCRPCMKTYQQSRHQARRATVNPAIHARNSAHRASLGEVVDAARAAATCSRCGKRSADGVEILLLPPARLSGGKRLSDIVRNGWPIERVRPLLEATLADPAGVRCRRCLNRKEA